MPQSEDVNSVPSTEPLDILIIGAGPVGLATAIAALHRGITNIRVYDQTSAFTKAGQILDVLPNAIAALNRIDPRVNDFIKQQISPIDSDQLVHYCTISGRSLSTIDLTKFGNTARFQWSELQHKLLDMIPSDFVICNHYLADVVTDENQETAVATFVKNRRRKSKYKNWDGKDQGETESQQNPEEEIKVRAKLVIGADGINSVVRKCIYRDELPGMENAATPYYVGLAYVLVAGTMTLPPELESALKSSVLKKCHNSIALEPEHMKYDSTRMILIKRPYEGPESIHLCAYIISIDEEAVVTSSKEEMLKKAEENARMQGFPPEAVAMGSEIVKHVGYDSVIVRPLYIHPVCSPPPFEKLPYGGDSQLPPGMERPWYHGRVILVGDALHAAPPTLGQGSAMGFEDALVLTDLLKKHKVYEGSDERDSQFECMQRTFSEYRAIREPRLKHYQKYSTNRTTEGNREKFLAEREEMYNGLSDWNKHD